MVPDRLTPFGLAEDEPVSGPDIESVDGLIARRKAETKRLKKITRLKQLGVFLLTLTLGLMVYVYLSTPISTVKRIEIHGNRLLDKAMILDVLDVNVGSPLYATDLVKLHASLTSIDLVKSGSVTLLSGNILRIDLIEKRGVALILMPSELILLTDDAQFITMDASRLLKDLNLPLVVGIDDTQELSDLALILGTLDDEILVNISEIHKEKTLFDEPQLRLMMQGRNIVFAPLSAVSALDKYFQVVKMTNPSDSCFQIADISFSVVKLDCPTD